MRSLYGSASNTVLSVRFCTGGHGSVPLRALEGHVSRTHGTERALAIVTKRWRWVEGLLTFSCARYSAV